MLVAISLRRTRPNLTVWKNAADISSDSETLRPKALITDDRDRTIDLEKKKLKVYIDQLSSKREEGFHNWYAYIVDEWNLEADVHKSGDYTGLLPDGDCGGETPCSCGDTLIASRTLTAADPIIASGPCSGDGLIIL